MAHVDENKLLKESTSPCGFFIETLCQTLFLKLKTFIRSLIEAPRRASLLILQQSFLSLICSLQAGGRRRKALSAPPSVLSVFVLLVFTLTLCCVCVCVLPVLQPGLCVVSTRVLYFPLLWVCLLCLSCFRLCPVGFLCMWPRLSHIICLLLYCFVYPVCLFFTFSCFLCLGPFLTCSHCKVQLLNTEVAAIFKSREVKMPFLYKFVEL